MVLQKEFQQSEQEFWRDGRRRSNTDALWFGIVISLLVHVIFFLSYDYWIRILPKPKQQSRTEPIPLEFVEVPPQPKKPPPDTKRRAVNDSVAGGKANRRRPLATRPNNPTAPRTSSRTTPPPAQPRRQQPSSSRRESPEPPKPQIQPPQAQPPIATAPNRSKPVPKTPNLEQKPANRPSTATERSPARTTARTQPRSSGAASKLGGPLTLSSRDLAANPNRSNRAAPGIDARQDVDMGSYLQQLQRQVRQQWIPGMTQNSRSTVVFFTVTRSGQVTNLRIVRPSGSNTTDTAAISAIRRAAPFAPLPSGFAYNSLKISFTFNINVSGGLDLWVR
ncbi:TonB family protein [Chroococcidiopsis sp.]|uniref:energy transducer TonB family protein n=1 Tax=Chroococcidiopsis sp. TaxID=3088168 RepID=UPI003F2D086E